MVGTNGFHENFHAEEPAIGSDRSFCFFFAGLSTLAAVYVRQQPLAAAVLAGAAAVLLLAGLTRPSLAAPLNRAWGKLGLLLARITNPIILFALYALVVAPTGIVLQCLGKKRALA
ncbi:MAG: hypothetical protein EBV03_11330, partial [Proteobacteria bacterium]|nr:hypothetical protein [Pseudomonadota bacterium]